MVITVARPSPPTLFVIDRLGELLVARDRRAVHQHVDDGGLLAIQPERTRTRDPTPMKAHPGTPYDCDAPGYSGGKPKMVWGSMVDGESPAGWAPGRRKIS